MQTCAESGRVRAQGRTRSRHNVEYRHEIYFVGSRYVHSRVKHRARSTSRWASSPRAVFALLAKPAPTPRASDTRPGGRAMRAPLTLCVRPRSPLDVPRRPPASPEHPGAPACSQLVSPRHGHLLPPPTGGGSRLVPALPPSRCYSRTVPRRLHPVAQGCVIPREFGPWPASARTQPPRRCARGEGRSRAQNARRAYRRWVKPTRGPAPPMIQGKRGSGCHRRQGGRMRPRPVVLGSRRRRSKGRRSTPLRSCHGRGRGDGGAAGNLFVAVRGVPQRPRAHESCDPPRRSVCK